MWCADFVALHAYYWHIVCVCASFYHHFQVFVASFRIHFVCVSRFFLFYVIVYSMRHHWFAFFVSSLQLSDYTMYRFFLLHLQTHTHNTRIDDSSPFPRLKIIPSNWNLRRHCTRTHVLMIFVSISMNWIDCVWLNVCSHWVFRIYVSSHR